VDQYEVEKEVEIRNEFDYSNIVAEIQPISYLVQYCESLFNQLMNMINEEEQRNEKLKSEFRNYQYKKSYTTKFEVSIKEKGQSFSGMTCKSYESFLEAVNGGHLKNVDSITITLDMNYKRGKDMSLQEHENSFKFVFKPYDIKFTRKSNFSEVNMNQVENNFNQILKQFKTQNSIFCTKE